MEELPNNPSWIMKKAVNMSYKKRYRLSKWFCLIQRLFKPDDYYALCWFANAIYMLGSNNDVKADLLYRRAININPLHPLAHAGLGRIHHDNALYIDQSYRNITPGGAWSMFCGELTAEEIEDNKGFPTAYSDSHQANRNVAIKELETAAKLSQAISDKVDLLLMAANIHCIIDNEKAIKAYKDVLSLDSNNIQAHFHLAGCYASTGDRKHAINEYCYIKRLAPELDEKVKNIFAEFGIDENGEDC